MTTSCLGVLLVSCAGDPVPRAWRQLEHGSAEGFNLLLITLDTTRADHLGCYGGPVDATPNLDRLADEGVRFAEAICTAPVTLPSHASILTGLYPPNHRVRHNGGHRLDQDHLTLAETLREDGYSTAAFVSAFVLDARFGLDQGFESYDDRVTPTKSGTAPPATNERSAGAVAEAAMEWLRQRPPDRPYFLWVHFFDPHDPYSPPEEIRSRYPNRPYLGEVAYMDSQVGRLLHTLDQSGDRDRTLVLVVGDHGESLGEHGELTHGIFIYDAVIQVPMILSCPALVSGPVLIDGIVSTVDLFPTLVELLGIAGTGPVDGISLVGLSPDTDRWVFVESMVPYLDFGWAPLVGVRRGHDKLIRAPRSEYYNLNADPDETVDLHDAGDQKTESLLAELEMALAGLEELWPELASLPSVVQFLDSETAARLQQLGYLGGARPSSDGPLVDPKDRIGLQNAVNEANALFSLGRFEQAHAAIGDAISRWPGDRTALFLLAKTSLRLGKMEEAELALRRSAEIQPNADVLLLLAQIETLDGRFEEASSHLDLAESLAPLHGGLAIARGDIYRAKGHDEEAIASYRRAAEIDPYRAAAAAERRIAQLGESAATRVKP